MLAQMREQGAKVFDREAAIVLRAIEQGARGTRPRTTARPSYLDLVARLLDVTGQPRIGPAGRPAEPADSAVNLLC